MAYSCDLQPCAGPHPEWHLQMDMIQAAGLRTWDMGIFFPPCTHLAVSGSRHFAQKRADGRQQEGIDFFMQVVQIASSLPYAAIENPVGIMSSIYRQPDQIIQPYQFGDDASKKTCLWLFNLPMLKPTEYVEPRITPDGKQRWANQTDSGQNNLPPSEHRGQIRSKTYPGIALAMATQWAHPEKLIIQPQLFTKTA